MVKDEILLECGKSLKYVCSCICVTNATKDSKKRDFFAKYLLDNNIDKNKIKNALSSVNKNDFPTKAEMCNFYDSLQDDVDIKEEECDTCVDYIKQGDCLELMKQMNNDTVDVSFTSPPYNDTGTKNESVSNLKSHNTHKKYLYVENRKDWFEWQCEVIDEMLRVSKKYVLYNVQGLKSNRENVYKLIGHYANRIHDIVIWYKPNNKLTRICEFIFVFCRKDEYKTFCANKKVKSVSRTGQKYYENIYNYIEAKNNDGSNSLNKATYSSDLCEQLLNIYGKPNMMVYDSFNGTGTTGVACIKLGMNYIGSELSEKQCEYSIDRLNETLKELKEVV